jgi:hypothetical protein
VDSITTVQRTLRNLARTPGRAVCPACGRAIPGDQAVRLQGQRFHRGCAFYSARRSAG